MAVPYTFGTATSSIPLSQLDSNFNTVITLGNTAIQLGNTVTTLNNMTLANVTISSGNVTITNVAITTANVTTANITTAVIGTETVTTSTITTANVTTANITTGNITNGTVITSLTLSYGTANGVTYLNGSKVLTSGSALTFDGTNFATTGNITLENARYFQSKTTGGSTIRMLGITSGNTAYVGPIDSGPGDMLLNASSSSTNIQFYASGSEQMRLTTTGLGIGTSSPAGKLEVSGGRSWFTANNEPFSLAFRYSSSSGVMYMGATNSVGTPSIQFSNSGGSALATIDYNGNVGIGQTSPAGVASRTFTVQYGGADGTVSITAGDYAGSASMIPLVETLGNRYDGNTTFGGRIGAAFRRSDGTAIAAGHNLGYYAFGGQWGTDTTYQSAKLLYAASIIGVAEGSFTSATAMPTAISFCTGSTGGQFQTPNTGYGTERMRIDSSGNVGIGTTAPGAKLQVSSAANQAALFKTSGAGSYGTVQIFNTNTNGEASIGYRDNSDSDATSWVVGKSVGASDAFGWYYGSTRMLLDTAGIVTMSAYGAGAATFSAAGVISSVSDETWKIKDGVPVDPDAMLKKLEPGYWYYNDEKKETFGTARELGFYAQNVNAAIGPEAAPTPEEGKPWGYYDRSVLAVTVMSLQKALATIESLTARIEALER